MINRLPPQRVRDAVKNALSEDLGDAGDLTTNATISETAQADAAIVARKPGIVAGIDFASAAFSQLSPEIECTIVKDDGARISPGDTILTVKGPARGVLSAERVALNFMGRLSRHRDGDRCACGRRQRRQSENRLHKEDNARLARL